jgi:hypothetical protein
MHIQMTLEYHPDQQGGFPNEVILTKRILRCGVPSRSGCSRGVLQDNVEIAVNSTARVDMKMQVGQVAETITVEAGAALLQTDRAEVKAEMTAK